MRFVVLAVLLASPALASADDAPPKPVRLDDGWRAPPAQPKQQTEMPWLWQQLRREVYDQLPRYRKDALTFTLSPVVVDGVAGIGIAGDF